MGKDVLYKFYVIKLEKPPNKCLGKYLCVPRSWTSKAPEDANKRVETDCGRVRAWYPFESSLISKRVRSRIPPDLNQGEMHLARVKYRTDVYRHAISWIKLKESEGQAKCTEGSNSPLSEQSEDNQLPYAKELSPTPDKQGKPVEICDRVDLTIAEDSKDEPVTSSSPNNIIDNCDDQKYGDIPGCLIVCMQALLKDIEKEKKERFRFEFDELRIVRVCDNNLLDSLSKLTINTDHINCGVRTTEALTPVTQKAPEVVIEIAKSPAVAQETPSSTMSPIASLPQPSPPPVSIRPAQDTPIVSEYFNPSNGRPFRTHPSPQISAYTEALQQIALNVKNLTENSTVPDTLTSSMRPAPQNLSEPIVINYPLTMKATRHHPTPLMSVSPAAISSTTMDNPRSHHVHPTVTICSPEEINGRFASQNSSNPLGLDSTTNERISPQNPSKQMGIYPQNDAVRPAIKSLLTRRRYSHYTSALVSAISATNNRPNSQHIENSVSPNSFAPHCNNPPPRYHQMPPHNASTSNVTYSEQYERFAVQTSTTPTAATTNHDFFVRSLVQDPYHRQVHQNSNESPSRAICRAREEMRYWNQVHSSITREPYIQSEYVPNTQPIRRRQSTIAKERSGRVILLD